MSAVTATAQAQEAALLRARLDIPRRIIAYNGTDREVKSTTHADVMRGGAFMLEENENLSRSVLLSLYYYPNFEKNLDMSPR